MPLMEHLRELRNRIVKMALAGRGHDRRVRVLQSVWHLIERPLCHAVIRGHTGCQALGVN